MIKICLPVILLLIFSCSNKDQSKNIGKKEVLARDTFTINKLIVDTSQEEGWGADIRISVVENTKTDTSITYIATSSYDSRIVGLQLTIPTNTPNDKKADAQPMLIKSLGEASDNLIILLSRLYKQKIDSSLHFVGTKRIVFIDLDEFAKKQFGQYPNNPSGSRGLKAFFESEIEDDYGEIYINLNEKEHWIELREKDEGYRKAVLKGLTSN
ncbi:MAG: hypothetical protein IPP31_02610 [Chitinophagaceae bacterium]|nr:hypothetical protein [Chitinophagaceae bacterium]